jgi:hypothetical protein
VRASRDVDGKNVFALSGRGIKTHLIVNAESGRLADTDFTPPTGAAGLPGRRDPEEARKGFAVPIGERTYDNPQPISPTPRPRAPAHEKESEGIVSATPPPRSSRSPPCRWPVASAATCPSSTSTSAPAAARAHRVRPLAAHRHQALRPGLRHRPHRGRGVQRRERPRAARIPRNCKVLIAHRRVRHQRRPAGAAQPPGADDHPAKRCITPARGSPTAA